MFFKDISYKIEKLMKKHNKESEIISFEEQLSFINTNYLSLHNPVSFNISNDLNISLSYYKPFAGLFEGEAYKNIIIKFLETNINFNISQSYDLELKNFVTTHVMIDKAIDMNSHGFSFLYNCINNKLSVCNSYTTEEDIGFFNLILQDIHYYFEDSDLIKLKHNHFISALKILDKHLNHI